ncbi:MAG: M20/M25/M40 family metallo-hydrolase [Anaerolineales bacterium]
MHPSIVPRVLDLAGEIQQIPAPTFSESARANFIQHRFIEENLVDVDMDRTGNVYGRLPGRGEAPPLVVSAHMDTVFPTSIELRLVREAGRICGPGIGDNSLGVASLFGLLWGLTEHHPSTNPDTSSPVESPHHPDHEFASSTLPGDLWLVANVGEEGLGDLRGMRAVVDRFGDQPLAYLVLEGMALGQIYHRGLGVRRYRITVSTKGGHSWVDFGRPSAVHELAAFINRLTAIPLRDHPRTTLNVGRISGGTSINTIASHAELELDLRSEDLQVLLDLAGRVEALVKASNRPEVEFSYQQVGDRPVGGLPAQHPLVRLAQRSLMSLGIQPCLNIGSTDANIPLSQGIPAICLGLTTGARAHTPDEYINTAPLAQGLRQILLIVRGAFNQLVPPE